MKRHILMFLALFCIGSGIANATTFLQLQSTYLGDGWFQYQMNVLNDPFFTEADVNGLQIGFTNETESSTCTTNWINDGWTNSSSDWSFNSGIPSRPYDVTFKIHSSETSYKMGTNLFTEDAMVLLTLYLTSMYPGSAEGVFSQDIVGYATMPCLVPCPPEEADNSPTNFVYDLKLVPDVTINQLIQTNGQIQGVDFDWASEATFILQGTKDFNNWTNITYVWSYPPETVWTTNQSLNDYGSYFRLELVTDGHSSNVPSLTSNLRVAPKIPAQPLRVTGTQLIGDKIVVGVSSSPGQTCYVQALDSLLIVRQSQQVVSSGTASASFDPAGLPNPVFFRAVLSP